MNAIPPSPRCGWLLLQSEFIIRKSDTESLCELSEWMKICGVSGTALLIMQCIL